jgi:hypothetical protein
MERVKDSSRFNASTIPLQTTDQARGKVGGARHRAIERELDH